MRSSGFDDEWFRIPAFSWLTWAFEMAFAQLQVLALTGLGDWTGKVTPS
ncbi:MAG: hypothetical protein RJA81_825 [Planctomycetota bacterium]